MVHIKNVVFEGGSTRCVALAGVYKALEEYGIQPKVYAGTSSGSIGALLGATGHTAEEMQKIVMDIDFNKFKDTRSWWITKPFAIGYNLVKYWGAYSTDYLREVVTQIIANKSSPTIDFENAYKQFGTKLITLTTNVNRQCKEQFDYVNKPSTKIADGVLASASIPGFFIPTIINGDKYGDGGGTDDLAINLFKDELDETIAFRYSDDGLDKDRVEYNSVIDYLIGYGQTVLENTEQEQIDESGPKGSVWKHIVTIPTDIGMLDFNLTTEQKQNLINAGYEATKEYLESLGLSNQ